MTASLTVSKYYFIFKIYFCFSKVFISKLKHPPTGTGLHESPTTWINILTLGEERLMIGAIGRRGAANDHNSTGSA